MANIKTNENPLHVHETTDYSLFQGYVGNRGVSMAHVNDLIKSIARKNMLPQNPIMVNEKMQVIDGQHRLEAAKANKLPIYYMIVAEGDLGDIQALNTTALKWTGYDYLQSYIALGSEPYIELASYLQTGVSLPNLVRIFGYDSKKHGSGLWFMFKRGDFTFRNREEGEVIVQALVALRPYTTARAWKDREFVGALRRTLQDVSLPELVTKLEEYGQRIEARASQRDYLRQFEEIINWNLRSNITRLF